ncbi:MAG: Rrf2 family transcriptional regulator [Oscillospiraceae bacterium]|nr:Rrf2 family transcriptional regulator [Oscillospiraceae bacterium]
MKISTKGRYALRMMADLAAHSSEGVVALKDIAERQSISKKYLEQIVPLLNRAQLLRTNRGYKGGYTLSKDPSEYTVGEILRVTEGDLAPVTCLQEGSVCERRSECATLHIWEGLYKVVSEYLDGITLLDVANEMTKLCKIEEGDK